MSASVFQIPYGDTTIRAELPERTRVIKQTNKPLPALPDPTQAVRDALNSPIAHEPLSKLVNSKSKVTIAFDDLIGYVPPEKQPGFREVAIKVLLEELSKLGVDSGNIRLVCAIALHRMWTQGELATILGDELVYRSSVSRLFNFDAEDKDNLVFLGETKRGQEVEVSRLVTDSDQLIYVSHPWSHFTAAGRRLSSVWAATEPSGTITAPSLRLQANPRWTPNAQPSPNCSMKWVPLSTMNWPRTDGVFSSLKAR